MNTQRIFIPGDHWIYYKLYCGARTADSMLTETLLPLTEMLVQNGVISKWFFIRYADPDFHIRLRFYVEDTNQAGEVIAQLHQALSTYVADHMIHKIQLDTYTRELERYGAGTIEVSEELFYYESRMLLRLIEVVEEDALFFLSVLRAIDRLLHSFEYSIEQKLALVTVNAQAFKKEFEANKQLNKQLDKKYRNLREQVAIFLTPNPLPSDYAILDQLLADWQHGTQQAVAFIKTCNTNRTLEVQLDYLISSYIHMLVNRAFRSRQRFYELVCYDFLTKYYRSKQYQHV